jgi:hypothetical protein
VQLDALGGLVGVERDEVPRPPQRRRHHPLLFQQFRV